MPIVAVNGGGNIPQGGSQGVPAPMHRDDDFAARNILRRLGVSALGVFQVMRGEIITSPQDRAKVADIVAQALNPTATVTIEVR